MKTRSSFYLRTAALLSTAIVMCCSAAMLSSCKEDKENPDEPKVTPSLAVSPTTLPVAATGGTGSFTVTANVEWMAVAAENFVTFVSPASGATTSVVTVNVTENTSTEPRTTTITVTGEGVAAKTVTVAQSGAGTPPPPPDPTFEVTPAEVEVDPAPAEARSIIEVTTEDDITWTATSTAKTIEEAQAMGFFPYVWNVTDAIPAPGPGTITMTGSGTFNVYTPSNEGLVSRSGTITVASTDGEFSRVVTFTQNPIPRIAVSPLSVDDVPKAGAAVTVKVISSVPWSITTTGGVATVSPTSGNGGAEETFTISIGAQSASGDRTGSVVIKGEGLDDVVIPVQQRGTDPTSMEYIVLNNLKWAKYNQGYAGAFPAKVTMGGVFFGGQAVTSAACPAGWRQPTMAEWLALGGPSSSIWNMHDNASFRTTIDGVNGTFLDGDNLSPSLNTHIFLPFFDDYATTIFYAGTPDSNDFPGIKIGPQNNAKAFWCGGDADKEGPSKGQRVRCVQD
jgi:hypothetical protein